MHSVCCLVLLIGSVYMSPDFFDFFFLIFYHSLTCQMLRSAARSSTCAVSSSKSEDDGLVESGVVAREGKGVAQRKHGGGSFGRNMDGELTEARRMSSFEALRLCG